MDPFWSNIYDDAKDKRYSGLFITILLLLLVGLPLIALAVDPLSKVLPNFMDALTGYPDFNSFHVVCLVLLAALALVAMVLFVRRWLRIERKARQERLKYSALSRDELMKARLKLTNRMRPVKFRSVERPGKRPALRAPNVDLKY